MTDKHPTTDLLTEYAAGVLPIALTIAVRTHLHFCEQCQVSVESLEHVGGEMLSRLESFSVNENMLDRVLQKIQEVGGEGEIDDAQDNAKRSHEHPALDSVASALPENVKGLLPDGQLSWRFLSPSLKVATISVGESAYELALHRIQAGGKAPAHDHNGQEITVVLTGSFSDAQGIYRPGDFIIKEQGDTHRPIAAQNEDCICLSVLSAPIRLTGFNRIFNPLLQFSPS